MRYLVALSMLCFGFPLFAAEQANHRSPNVLFIAIDDLNDWVGCLGGHPQAKTPNIDAIAARGTLFLNAHCQAPLCNPSRNSMMTGLRPSSTGIYGLAPGLRDVALTKDRITLSQTFTRAGYYTYSCGKIYHDGSLAPKHRDAEFNVWGPAPGPGRPATPIANLPQPRHVLMDWGVWPPLPEQHGDFQIADAAIGALQGAPVDKPFFIACGFRMPHVPCYAPQEYFDLYPMDTLLLPPLLDNDRDDLPQFADFLHWKLPEPRLSTLIENKEFRPLVRAYLASTSFMDAQIGRLIDALEATGRAGNTIVVVWSDHGWHLGEKAITGKNTLWQRSTRVPLVFSGPGIARGQCNSPVELLDVYPTLTEIAFLDAPNDLEGHSLAPQLTNAEAAREFPAITTHNQGNHSIVTKKWRYIHYADGSEELYDLTKDSNEWTNLAGREEFDQAKQAMARWLPKIDRPPAPGSAHRVLTYNPQTGDVVWEGQVIDKDMALPIR